MYLASDTQLTTNTGRPQLRSTSEKICVVLRTHNSFVDRRFSAVGPRVWNALPSYLRHDANYRPFKQALKRHILVCIWPRRNWLFSCALQAYLLTYLLT